MKKITSLILAFLIICSMSSICFAAGPVDGFSLVLQTENLALYVGKTDGEIAVYDKKSDYTWYSNPVDRDTDQIAKAGQKEILNSQLVLSYADSSKNILQTPSFGNAKITTKKADDAFTVTYDFNKLKFLISVNYKLINDYLSVEMTFDEVSGLVSEATEESAEIKYELLFVSLLPYFGAGGLTDNGYIFIPDGNGALIEFNNKKTFAREYSEEVYDTDPLIYKNVSKVNKQTITMPVFGIDRENAGMFAIIEHGDSVSSINACISEKNSSYNYVYPKIRYKVIESLDQERTDYAYSMYSEPVISSNYKVRYYFLEKGNCDYSAMANTYRNYLINEQGLQKKADSKEYLYVELLGGVLQKKNVLGVPLKLFNPMTTFEQAKEIVKELKDRSIDSIVLKYNSWTKKGEKYKPQDVVSFERKMGGKKGFDEFTEYLKNENVEFYPNFDFVRIYKSGNGISNVNNSCKTINQSNGYQKLYNIATALPLKTSGWVLLNATSYKEATERLLSDLKKNNINKISVDTLGNILASDFTTGIGVKRNEAKVYVEDSIKSLAEGNELLFTNANVYAMPYAKHNIAMADISSNFDIADKSVPFSQLVLHGYVNYSQKFKNFGESKEDTVLRAVETGSNIAYSWFYGNNSELIETEYNYMYSAEYRDWLDNAEYIYKTIKPVMEATGGAVMLSHNEVLDDVYKIVYDNGTCVYVNYSSENAELDGITVEARNFIMKQGD